MARSLIRLSSWWIKATPALRESEGVRVLPLFFDVALYVLVMAAFFLLPCFLRTPVWSRTRLLWVVLVLALGAATFVFTWCPPDGLLFRDLSLPTFYSLPC